MNENIFDSSGERCVWEGRRGHRDGADMSGGEDERVWHRSPQPVQDWQS